MNLSDSEIVRSILLSNGMTNVLSLDKADVILLNTCSIRDNAEDRIFKRIDFIHHFLKKNKKKAIIGILGCMSERLKDKLFAFSNAVSLVVGPDEYRKMPEIIKTAMEGGNEIAVDLSLVETYGDIIPSRDSNLLAWVSIMRGCNNFCSYCVVPYTRGRERSRSYISILEEINRLKIKNYKEVTLLGQNVNSYNDAGKRFPELLSDIASIAPDMRIRFVTSHPRDMSDDLIEVIAKYDNICKYIHLPIQSGSNRILKDMNRHYTVEHFMNLIDKIRSAIPNCAISTDVIAGYPIETLEDHKCTLSIMKEVRFDSAYMFKYSSREGTKSAKMYDEVSEEEKIRRLNEIIEQQNKISREKNNEDIGKEFEILVETPSKKNKLEWTGRTDTNKVVIFDNKILKHKAGDIIKLKINRATSATLFGSIIN